MRRLNLLPHTVAIHAACGEIAPDAAGVAPALQSCPYTETVACSERTATGAMIEVGSASRPLPRNIPRFSKLLTLSPLRDQTGDGGSHRKGDSHGK